MIIRRICKKIKYEDLIGQFDLIMDPIKGLIMSKN
jgi:hypothetical protein